MSGTREENVRLRISTVSDLPSVSEDLEELIRLNKLLLEQSHQNALSARVDNAMVVTAIGGVTDALKSQKKAGEDAGNSTSDGAKKSAAELEKLAGQVRNFATLVGAAFTFDKVKDFGMEIIDTKTKIDSLKIALDVMLGSKAESAKLYAEFVQLAKTTPFTLEEVAEQGVKLKAYNIATADLIPTITALGNMAAAVGKEKLPQLTLAYGQVANTGKLMGTELKQFTEAGIPLYDLLAKAMDKPKEAVIELAHAHQISFADVRKAILEASQEGGKYFNLMALQAKTVGGEVDKLKDTYQQAKVRIGDFFENIIKSGTQRLGDLLDATLGSNSAIERTLDIVKSAAAAFLTYQVATRAQAAASTALVAIETTKNVIYGAYLLLMRQLTQQQIVYTAEQQAATIAAQNFNLVLSKNPIGAAVAVIGLLTTAYYAFKAANEEVVSQLGEEEIRLRTERDNLNALASAAILATNGSKQRKDAIDALIKNYPAYFSGLNAEKTNNTQLLGILDSVNKVYARRIDLAREAYKNEGIAKAQEELFRKEEAFFNSLAKLNNDRTLELQFGGSVKKLIETLDAGGASADKLRKKLEESASHGAEFFGQSARSIASQFVALEKQSADSASRTLKINTDALAAEVTAIKKKYDVLEQEAAGNTKKLKALKEQEAAEIAKIEGKASEISYNNTVNNEEKKKQVVLLSEKEIAVIKKQNDDNEQLSRLDQLKQQIDFLNKKEAEEIQSIVRATIARKTSEAEMVRLREQARQQVATVDARYDKERAAIILQIEAENQKIFIEKTQETQDKIKVLTEKRLAAEAILAKVNAAKTEEDRLAIIKEYDGKIGLEIQNAATEELKVQRDASEKKLALVKAEKGEVSKEYRAAYDQFLKDDLAYNTAMTKQAVDGAKDRVKTVKDYEEEIRKSRKETAELEKDAADSQKKMLKDLGAFLGQFAGQQSGVFGSLVTGVGTVIGHFQDLKNAGAGAAQSALDDARKNLDQVKAMYDDSTAQGAAAIADAESNVAKAQAGLAKAEQLSFSSVLSIAGAIYQVFTAIADAYNKARAEVFQAVADAYGKITETFKTINEEIARSTRESLDYQLQNTNLNLEQRKQLINDYYANELERTRGQDRIQAMLDFNQKAAQISADAGTNIKKFMEEMYRLRQEQDNAQYELAIRDAQHQVEQAALVRDATIEFLNQEFEAFKATKQKEIDEEEKKLNKLKALNEQASSDQQLRLQEDDAFRSQLLKQGEAREVKALEDARDREIKRATEAGASAEEVANIKNAFEALITKKHAEYQDAQSDKTKQTSLATIEVKAQEKDQALKLEDATADKITKLQLEIANMQARTEFERKLAQQDYAAAKDRSERAIFENTKALQLAQLDAEIAIVNSKRKFFGIGDGAINEAIGQLEGAKNQIGGLGYTSTIAPVGSLFTPGTTGIGAALAAYALGLSYVPTTPLRADNKEKITSAYDKAGNFLQLTFNGMGKKITVFDKDHNPFDVLFADGYVPVTGEKYAKGTEFVKGDGYIDGVDTVPSWLTKGERVFTVDQNKLFAGISNEQAVERVVNYDSLMEKATAYENVANQFPKLFESMGWQDIANARITLPQDIAVNQLLTQNLASPFDTDRIIRSVKDMQKDVVHTIQNKKETHLTIDKNGFSTALLSAQAKTEFIQNRLNR